MVGTAPCMGYNTHAGMIPTPAGMGGKTGHAHLPQGTGFFHWDLRRHGETTLPPPHPSNLDGRSYSTALNQTQAYMGIHGLYGSVAASFVTKHPTMEQPQGLPQSVNPQYRMPMGQCDPPPATTYLRISGSPFVAQ
ncbi:unnamed protein product [Meganyctiphanes norvegica]|uniref:Uncharacterized protein n=1 Tax=Meganyctiphanes norvegica TaxID=48144 RepID=A0AAV2STQ6_MEGNR